MKSIKGFFHHFFVPHHKNNFRARALHHDLLTVYFVFTLLFVFSIKFIHNTSNNVLGFATDITTQKLLELTNLERQQNSLSTVSISPTLSKAAFSKAQDMFAKNYWAHYAPDGKSPWNFIQEAGYQYEYAGENLAKNFLSSHGVVDAWMASPSHRENILRPEYTEIGFAVVNGLLNDEETTLVVQMFGKPTTQASPSPLLTSIPAQTIGFVKPAGAVSGVKKVVLPTSSPFNMFGVFIAFLVTTLIIDLFVAYRYNITRYHGKNIAHLIFLVFISIGFLLFISKGGIV